jgi:hypothetical protein
MLQLTSDRTVEQLQVSERVGESGNCGEEAQRRNSFAVVQRELREQRHSRQHLRLSRTNGRLQQLIGRVASGCHLLLHLRLRVHDGSVQADSRHRSRQILLHQRVVVQHDLSHDEEEGKRGEGRSGVEASEEGRGVDERRREKQQQRCGTQGGENSRGREQLSGGSGFGGVRERASELAPREVQGKGKHAATGEREANSH